MPSLRFTIALGLLLGCLPWPRPAIADEQPYRVEVDFTKQALGRHVQAFIDEGGQLSFDALLASNPNFTGLDEDKPIFGFIPDAAVWLRLTLNNASPAARQLLLEFAQPINDDLRFYQQDRQGAWRETQTGDRLPFAERPFEHRNFVFPLDFAAGETRQFYLRIQTAGINVAPVTLWDTTAFRHADRQELLAHGFYFGILGVMIFYNLFLFFALRDKSYGFYVGQIISFALMQAAYDGIAFELLWPNSPRWGNFSMQFFIGVTTMFAAMFTRDFLGTRQRTPRWDRYLQFVFLLGLAQILLLFWDRAVAIRLSAPVGLFMIVGSFGASITAWRGGYRPARFYVYAYIAFAAGVALIDLVNLGLIPINFWTTQGWRLGTAGEVLLLSLALADRINAVRREKEAAQAQTLASEQKAAEKERAMARSFFRFVPQPILELLGLESVVHAQLGNQVQKTMTVLFSDIRDFTSLSENKTPSETFTFINRYLATAGPVVRRHQGFIDKYLGDGIMALFPQSADDALAAAIALVRAAEDFSLQLKREDHDEVEIGVGMHTGTLMLGIIGEHARLESTVISDAVNLASRLEGLTKIYGAHILLSEATVAALSDRERFQLRYLGKVQVKGKHQRIGVYECVDADSPNLIGGKMAVRAEFETAVALLEMGDVDGARRGLRAVLAACPRDNAARYLLDQTGRQMQALEGLL